MKRLYHILSTLDSYRGDCLDADTLSWILRVGACAYQFTDLLQFFEHELKKHCSPNEISWMNAEMKILRQSKLQYYQEAYGALDGRTYRTYRLRLLGILLHQVEARSRGAVSRSIAVLWPEERQQLQKELNAFTEEITRRLRGHGET